MEDVSSTFCAEQLLGARRAAEALLDEIGIRNFRYDVEPREGAFDVYVEHEHEGAWHDVTLREDADALLRTNRDRASRMEMAGRWRERLRAAPPT